MLYLDGVRKEFLEFVSVFMTVFVFKALWLTVEKVCAVPGSSATTFTLHAQEKVCKIYLKHGLWL